MGNASHQRGRRPRSPQPYKVNTMNMRRQIKESQSGVIYQPGDWRHGFSVSTETEKSNPEEGIWVYDGVKVSWKYLRDGEYEFVGGVE